MRSRGLLPTARHDRVAALVEELRPGPRDHVITRALRHALTGLDPGLVDEARLDAAEGPTRLARHLAAELERALREADDAIPQATLMNDLIETLGAGGEAIDVPPAVLRGIRGRSALGHPVDLPPNPAIPFSQSDLLVNAEGQPNIGSELRAELGSADSVDLICAFVIWSGVRHVSETLRGVVGRG